MTNYPFDDIKTFNDVAVVNEYQIVKQQGGDVSKLLDKHKKKIEIIHERLCNGIVLTLQDFQT